MAATYHSFGPCAPMVPFGSSAAYVLLGIATEGGSITLDPIIEEVHTDAAGRAPAELQILGETATVRFKLASWDATLYEDLMRMASGIPLASLPLVGQSGAIGTFLKGAGCSHSLYLPSADLPWVFPNGIFRRPKTQSISTRYGEVDLEYFAWRYLGPTVTSVGSIALYSNTAPS